MPRRTDSPERPRGSDEGMKLDHSPTSGSILDLDERTGSGDLVAEEPLLPFVYDPGAELSAAHAFSLLHEREHESFQGRYYSARMPVSLPGPGEQLAFEVDLDNCSGCKACVAACHTLNGLDDDEAWRSVGLLQGGTSALPVLQHITSACHHCLDPACLHGCPVNAYEKDPVTGIVKHLDDQCIGCQYCILKCPYDAPKYNKKLGIVRKCDMCSDRLTSGEAPACAQACPTQAIRISVVSVRDVIEDSEANHFLPGRARACLYTAHHGLPVQQNAAAKRVAGRPLRGEAGPRPCVARGHAGPDADVGRSVRGRPGAERDQ